MKFIGRQAKFAVGQPVPTVNPRRHPNYVDSPPQISCPATRWQRARSDHQRRRPWRPRLSWMMLQGLFRN